MSSVPTKIMIFGRPGSGKSSFALKLHKELGIPLYHLDKYYFTKDWVKRDYQEFLSIQQSLVDQDSWIIDGNCIKSFEMRYSKADLVLYFNYSRALCIWRVFKRLFYKNPKINDKAEGCPEAVKLNFLHYLWNFHNRVSSQIALLKKRYPAVNFMEIKSNRDLEKV